MNLQAGQLSYTRSNFQAKGGNEHPAGRKLYRAYLEWLCEEDSERKGLRFEKMSSGWAKGTQAFKKAVLDDLKDDNLKKIVESEAAQMRVPRWERVVTVSLQHLNNQEADLVKSPKAAL